MSPIYAGTKYCSTASWMHKDHDWWKQTSIKKDWQFGFTHQIHTNSRFTNLILIQVRSHRTLCSRTKNSLYFFLHFQLENMEVTQDGNKKDVWNNLMYRIVYPRQAICYNTYLKMLNKLERKKLFYILIFRTCINHNSPLQPIRSVNQQNLQNED